MSGPQFSFKSINTEARRRLVRCVVYEPNNLDTHGDHMTPEGVEKLAHQFLHMDLGAAMDLQHNGKPLTGCRVAESYIATEATRHWSKGSWVVTFHVTNDHIWAAIEEGKLNGVSFAAWVEAEEVEVEHVFQKLRHGLTEPYDIGPLRDYHQHVFVVFYDKNGRLIGGGTSPGPDGHVHRVTRTSITEPAGGGKAKHHHRWS